MGSYTNKRVVLGVTGGIAAYKTPELVRRLREAGAEVRVILTGAGARFVTPLTLQTVSGHPVHQGLLDAETESAMGHIDLARWADLLLVAPAGADFIARAAQGRADDLLAAVYLASDGLKALAPAMNRRMWQDPGTQANLARLRERGARVLGPASGVQACGETGPGRMLEPAELAEKAAGLFASGVLEGLGVLVTAGPTWEPIDPVRGISNRSSGKMGYAVAAAAAEAGARVTLVSGPTALAEPDRVRTLQVETAAQMLETVLAHVGDADIFIGVAAVADYRPAQAATEKLKKHAGELTLALVRNPDILATVAARRPAPFTVGFAAETSNTEANAREKLRNKGVDLVAANRVGVPGLGIGADDNRLLLIDRHGSTELPVMPKPRLARAFINEMARRYHAKDTTQDTRLTHRL